MEAAEAVRENLTLVEIGKGFVIAFLLAQFQSPSATELAGRKRRKPVWSSELISIGGYFGLFLLSRSWLALVNHYVPDSYLDEVFHVPQAQAYFEERYFDWDDKITTPPGLYLLSLAYHKLYMLADSSIPNLRSLNLLATLQTTLLVALCRNMIEANEAARQGRKDAQSFSFYTFHTALNVTLFPVLFFFSSLYYTDVFSTLLVLLAYQNHLARVSRESSSFVNDLWTMILGVGTLLMRQTNVFWVVVYMGGLEVVHALRSLNPPAVAETPRFGSVSELVGFYVRRYSLGDIYDPSLTQSWPDDWVICAASLAIAVVCNPLKVLRQVWPHITVLALFTGFVVWNGGVVLGDKSNHVVTIHFAQMLYIWPFFAFFSAPLLVTPVLSSVLQRIYPSSATSSPPAAKKQEPKTTTKDAAQAPRAASGLDGIINFVTIKRYYPLYLLGTVLLSLVVVKFNTVIHPFTLADNRHYMFYVFRYTILRPGLTRYFLVTAYLASRWLVWNRLAGCSPLPSLPGTTSADITKNADARSKGTDIKDKERPKAVNEKEEEQQQQSTTALPAFSFGGLGEPISVSAFSPPTSTVLLWLLTTALSLITAPLVEPRYFILPWVFWRLLVPAWPVRSSDGISRNQEKKGLLGWFGALGCRVDLTLVLETLWFLVINVGVMSVFLFRPFYWRNETGELLDDGRVQRFMW